MSKLKSGSSGKAIASFILGLSSFFCAFVTGIAAVIMGVLALADISKSNGRLQGNAFAIIGIVFGAIGCFWTLILIALLLPAVQQVREAARRTTSMNNVRQMVLGLHNFQSANLRFPPVEGRDQELSWRVHILPYLDEMQLYEQFNLDEPWNSPHNLTLVDKMPDIFKNPNLMLPLGQTSYLIPTTPVSADPNAPQAAFVQGQPGPRFDDFTDGISNTILIVEADADAAVTWTDPNGDWMYDPGDPLRSLGNVRPRIILVAMADGSSQTIDGRSSPETMNALITRDGGEILTPN